jgi:hypothetical protein
MADLLRRGRVVGRAARRARRRLDPPPVDRDALERLRALLPAGAVAASAIADVPANARPWTPAGLDLKAGEAVTTFCAGRVALPGPLGLWVDPAIVLWYRVGGRAPVFRGPRDTHGFTAAVGGRLELAVEFAGRWADPEGRDTTPWWERRGLSGTVHVLTVRWAEGADVDAALREAAAADPAGLAAAELARRAAQPEYPPGWDPLWDIGATEIYARADDGIACATHGDVGIVRHPVDVALSEATRLRWTWRVDELPSRLPEDTLPTHDYLSIALEFDDGTDLTWHWSAGLPVGHHYRCPLPAWRHREWHMAVRSGTADLGRWVTEERPVHADVAAAIGPPPRRIVAVWLISVSVFQRGTGRCAYREIALDDGEREHPVLW